MEWRRTTHTALNFRHWTVADPDGIRTRTPLRALVFRRVRLRSIRMLTASKINSGEKQTRVIPETSATARARTFDDSGPLEPFRCAAFAARQRSFSHPFFRRERGYHGGGSNLIFTARKRIPGENRSKLFTCSTVELPPRDVGEGRTRTDNHVVLSEVTLISLPGKLERAAGGAKQNAVPNR
jgi:hypothetical protein